MEFDNFNKTLSEELMKIEIQPIEEKNKKLFRYMNMLIEWNAKINLTTIIEPQEIITKHFVDSLTINKEIPTKARIIDVGTGAGFPGIPIAIYREDVQVSLLDSLNKRVNFLKDVIKDLELTNIETLCGRVEDIGNNKKYRETFDTATSRAVAPLNVLSEYMLPLVKINGTCICMKGPKYEADLEEGKNAIKQLGGKVERVEKICTNLEITRNLVIIRKINKTGNMYPRRAGTPSKNPIK